MSNWHDDVNSKWKPYLKWVFLVFHAIHKNDPTLSKYYNFPYKVSEILAVDVQETNQ